MNDGEEVCWLVEATTEIGPMWWCVKAGRFRWTNDANDAIRFATADSASAAAEAGILGGKMMPEGFPRHGTWRATQHVFVRELCPH